LGSYEDSKKDQIDRVRDGRVDSAEGYDSFTASAASQS